MTLTDYNRLLIDCVKMVIDYFPQLIPTTTRKLSSFLTCLKSLLYYFAVKKIFVSCGIVTAGLYCILVVFRSYFTVALFTLSLFRNVTFAHKEKSN